MSQIVNFRFIDSGKYFKIKNESCDKVQNNIHNSETETKLSTKLLRFDAMPRHLQFNPFVHTGYRPQMNAWECIASLTYLHNETINILSHGKILMITFFLFY